MDGLKAGQGKAFHSHYAKMDELNKDLTLSLQGCTKTQRFMGCKGH